MVKRSQVKLLDLFCNSDTPAKISFDLFLDLS
jgi:hypothetical protein